MDRYAPLYEKQERLRQAGLSRRLRLVEPSGPVTGRVEGRDCLLFCSNDYLGLAWHPEVRAAATGAGAGASRLISGHQPAHQALEEALSEWLGQPATLLPSGYQANLALFSTILPESAKVASDALNHASIIDGLRLSKARCTILPHCSYEVEPDTRLIAVESLYSMDGDIPDLRRYPSEPWLFVDEAHALGCLGPNGRGIAAMQGVQADFWMGTLGKALGAAGAFLVGPPILRELLVSAGRPLVYSTAPAEGPLRAARVALQLATEERREQLAANAARLRSGLQELGVPVLGVAHILPVLTGASTMTLANALWEQGIFVPGIRFPTVPLGQERLRFTVSAAHTPAQIDHCIATISALLRKLPAGMRATG